MKYSNKLSAIVITVLFLGFTFWGSNTAKAQPSIGIKAGLSMANLSADGVSLDTRTGFTVGAFTTIESASLPFAIQAELLYTQKGATGTGVSLFGSQVQNAEYTYKFDYIEVPVLAKKNFGGGGSISPYAVLGPYLGFTVTSDLKIEASGNSQTFDGSDQVSGTDFGLIGGVGLSFSAFDVEARYDLGVSSTIDGSEASNGAFLITAGYSF